MAVEALKSTEVGADYRGKPINDHGKLRVQYFNLPATTVAGDATSTVDLCDLPPGAVRIVPDLSRLAASAFGAGRTLDVGHRAYLKKDPHMLGGGTIDEAEDADAFIDGLDVSAAVTGSPFGAGLSAFGYKTKFDLFSKSGVTVFATVLGGTIPIGTTITGFIVYVYE